jgi:prepilin-type N-terminal cleavage/methylation domain-containing protein
VCAWIKIKAWTKRSYRHYVSLYDDKGPGWKLWLTYMEERTMRHKRAFTLIELLVVVGIIALLVSILMPALAKARELAKQLQCATQLSGMGKAVALYQSDYREINPCVGTTNWSGSWPFMVDYNLTTGAAGSPDRARNLYGGAPWLTSTALINTDGSWKYPTVGASLYLLVRYEDLVPKMFVCPSAEEGEEMSLEDAIMGFTQSPTNLSGIIKDWVDMIDFFSLRNLTFGYNDPFYQLLDSSANSSFALMADKSPAYYFINTQNATLSHNGALNNLMTASALGYPNPYYGAAGNPIFPAGADWTDKNGSNPDPGNSKNHGTECQNVLYVDSHVTKHTSPNVGLNNDNIYTFWGVTKYGTGGKVPTPGYKQVGTWKTTLARNAEDGYIMY